jgi:hypothetical protein
MTVPNMYFEVRKEEGETAMIDEGTGQALFSTHDMHHTC